MNTNVNLSAPLGVLAFLGLGFLVLPAALVLAHSIVARKPGRAKALVIIMLIIAGGYLGAVLLFAFVSSEKILAGGEEKYFCEIDCHLAYSIAGTRQAKQVGSGSHQSTARGIYTVVTIKTRFDEHTISAHRGNGLLYPNSRLLTLFDDHGNIYAPSPEGQRALDASTNNGSPLNTPLRPGESYSTEVAFDLPVEAKPASLLINEGEWLPFVIIGHENSPFHKKTKFQL